MNIEELKEAATKFSVLASNQGAELCTASEEKELKDLLARVELGEPAGNELLDFFLRTPDRGRWFQEVLAKAQRPSTSLERGGYDTVPAYAPLPGHSLATFEERYQCSMDGCMWADSRYSNTDPVPKCPLHARSVLARDE